MSVDYSYLPEHMQEGARLYVEHGVRPGDFLTAVICNNFAEAFSRADDVNLDYMQEWARWLWTEAPAMCWGSPQKVKEWCDLHAAKRLEAERAKEQPAVGAR